LHNQHNPFKVISFQRLSFWRGLPLKRKLTYSNTNC
jgi:hypothetical protein